MCEIDWYQNDWPWPFFRGRIKVMSTIAWHSTLNISEAIRDRGLVQRTTNGKWHIGYHMVTWPMTSCDPERCCEAVRSTILATAWLLVVSVSCLHVCWSCGYVVFCWMLSSVSTGPRICIVHTAKGRGLTAQKFSHMQYLYCNCIVEFYNIVRLIDNNEASRTTPVLGVVRRDLLGICHLWRAFLVSLCCSSYLDFVNVIWISEFTGTFPLIALGFVHCNQIILVQCCRNFASL